MQDLFSLPTQQPAAPIAPPLAPIPAPVAMPELESDIPLARTMLAAHLSKLPGKDQAFAQSLLNARQPTAKQCEWICRLARRAAAPAAAPVGSTLGDVSGVVALLERGAANQKSPAILLDAGARSIRLTIAGERARVPGSLTVTSGEYTGTDPQTGYGKRDWYGRVTRAGDWQPATNLDAATATAIGALLVALAADPAHVAGEYGRRTAKCCFCNTALGQRGDKRSPDAERSLAVGYGRKCASNYGLPW